MNFIEKVFNGAFDWIDIEDVEFEKSHNCLYVVFALSHEEHKDDLMEFIEDNDMEKGKDYFFPDGEDDMTVRFFMGVLDNIRYNPTLDKLEGFTDGLSEKSHYERNLLALEGKPLCMNMIDTRTGESFFIPTVNNLRISDKKEDRYDSPEEAIEAAEKYRKALIIETADIIQNWEHD